jgi:hypothetical protein
MIRLSGDQAVLPMGVQDMKIFGRQAFLKIAALTAAGLGTSGCVYDMGLGYASDGYYGDADGCDPYGAYDSYYQCDYGSGFNNIGYGGGWYDNYWYPGYGFFLFDNNGRRYPMRDHHRRYWGEKRHNWYREHRGRHRDGGRYHGRDRDGSHNATPGIPGQRDGAHGRDHDGAHRDNRQNGRPRRGHQWRGDENSVVRDRPVRDRDAVPGQRPGRRDSEDYGRPNRRNDSNAVRSASPSATRAGTPAQNGEIRGRGNAAPSPQPTTTNNVQTVQRPTRVAPAVRPQRPERPARLNRERDQRMRE